MNKLQWLFARMADRVGLFAGLAWLLLLAIIVYVFYVFLPAQQRLLVLEQQSLAIPKTQQVVYAYESPSEQFFAKIPHINTVTERIQTLFDVANKEDIVINEVIYKDEQRPGERVVRYTMNFSVIASYPVIKTFIVDTLAALPYLALEKLTFERDDIESNIVSAHLQFTLYMVP